jgi:hypothetical protein
LVESRPRACAPAIQATYLFGDDQRYVWARFQNGECLRTTLAAVRHDVYDLLA